MHFLAEGRNDRIQRWIAEQTPKSEESEENGTIGPNPTDAAQRSCSRAQKGEDGLYWQMEELEREMALTAYAFGRKNWPISTGSIDTNILDFADIKKLSQLAIEQGNIPQLDVGDHSLVGLVPERQHDKRRDARIVSQPPVIPPTPQEFDLPSPIIHRAAPVPPPIETTPHTSDVPHIAFVFQETSSPMSNSIHFTPAALDSLEAFPSTPRSFSSYLKHMSGEDQVKFQEFFLSPRLVTPKVVSKAARNFEGDVVVSPSTFYSMDSESCKSTPSLSAFPPTPASTFPSKVMRLPLPTKRETEMMPSVPEVPPSPPATTEPIIISSPVDMDKALPPSPNSTLEATFETPSTYIRTPIHTAAEKKVETLGAPENRDTDLFSDSASASEVMSAHLSSRFSVLSSKFSISSLEELDQSTTNDSKGGKWSSTVGKASNRSRSRAASVSTNYTGFSKKNALKSSSAPHSRTGSRNETGSFVHARGHSRAASKAGSRSGSLATPDLSASRSSFAASISEETPPPSHSHHPARSRADSLPQSSETHITPALVDNFSVSESPAHKTTNKKGRSLMSRISMGIRRSRSSGSNGGPRPRIQRNKTHTATLSGSNVPEHVYFNTNTDVNGSTTTAPVPSAAAPAASDGFSAIASPATLPTPVLPYSNSSSSKQPPRLTLTTQFGSTTSTPVIRYPSTPKTPASSVSTSFFGGEPTTAEPLPAIKWRECLILRGVNRDNRFDEPIIRWCQQLGEIEDILRVRGSGTIVVYFKDEDTMKKNRGVFEPREVNIAGVGIVTINWSRTMIPPERKASS